MRAQFIRPISMLITAYSCLSFSTTAFAEDTNMPDTRVPAPGTNVTAGRSSSSDAYLAPGYSSTYSAGPVLVSDPREPVIDAKTSRKTYPNRPLLVTGAVLLGGSYAASVIFAATNSREDDRNLYYPVAGPWMDLANRDCIANPCSNEDLNKGLLIADGVIQGLGALSILSSLFIPEKTTRHWYLIGQRSFQLSPARIGRSGYGFGAYGTF